MKQLFIAGAMALSFFMHNAVATSLELSEQDQRMLGIEVEAVARVEGASAGVLNMRVAFSPDAQWVMRAALPGVLTHVDVREGDRVQQGQSLATLRSPVFVELQQSYLQARAEFDVAENSRARDQRLRDAGSISERRWQATRSNFVVARAQLAGLESQLLAAGLDKTDLDELASRSTISTDLVLRAPAQALVLERDANPGTRVDESETLMRLGDPQELVLEALLSAAAAAYLEPGMRLQALRGDAGAVIDFVSSVIDPHSQTVSVRAVPDNATELRPGELSAWTVQEDGSALVVPAGAVVRLNDADVVYVLAPGGFDERVIDARSTATGNWIVNSGLEDGEHIAVRGTAVLKGMSLGMGGGD